MVGSVSESVLHDSKCPVLIVRRPKIVEGKQ